MARSPMNIGKTIVNIGKTIVNIGKAIVRNTHPCDNIWGIENIGKTIHETL